METFVSLLAVSPVARSGNSLNLHSRSRGSRHGRLGSNSLRGDGNHHKPKLPCFSLCEKRNFRGPLTDTRFRLERTVAFRRSGPTIRLRGSVQEEYLVEEFQFQQTLKQASRESIARSHDAAESLQAHPGKDRSTSAAFRSSGAIRCCKAGQILAQVGSVASHCESGEDAVTRSARKLRSYSWVRGF